MSIVSAAVFGAVFGVTASITIGHLRRWATHRIRGYWTPSPLKLRVEHAAMIIDDPRMQGWNFMRMVCRHHDNRIRCHLLGESVVDTLGGTPIDEFLQMPTRQAMSQLIDKRLLVVEDENGADVSHWPIEFWRIEDINARQAAYQAYQDAKL